MRIDDPNLVSALGELGVETRPGMSLAAMTSLGIGGTSDLLRIRRHEAIPGLLDLLERHGVAHKFLGGGSNLLVADGELPFVVLQLAQPDPDVVIEGTFTMVDATADLGRAVTGCGKHNLVVIDRVISEYGTVGVALRKN